MARRSTVLNVLGPSARTEVLRRCQLLHPSKQKMCNLSFGVFFLTIKTGRVEFCAYLMRFGLFIDALY